MTRPVLARKLSVRPLALRLSQYSLVRRHCQTMAWWMGSPVTLSQTMAVSRWLVMPMAAMSAAVAPIFCMASTATPSCVAQISFASCSTQPGFGKYWGNSRCETLHISPLSLKRMQRLEVVPASRAIMYFCHEYVLLIFLADLKWITLWWYLQTSVYRKIAALSLDKLGIMSK